MVSVYLPNELFLFNLFFSMGPLSLWAYFLCFIFLWLLLCIGTRALSLYLSNVYCQLVACFFFLFIPKYKLMLLKLPTRTTIAQSDNSDANEWPRRYVFFFRPKEKWVTRIIQDTIYNIKKKKIEISFTVKMVPTTY